MDEAHKDEEDAKAKHIEIVHPLVMQIGYHSAFHRHRAEYHYQHATDLLKVSYKEHTIVTMPTMVITVFSTDLGKYINDFQEVNIALFISADIVKRNK